MSLLRLPCFILCFLLTIAATASAQNDTVTNPEQIRQASSTPPPSNPADQFPGTCPAGFTKRAIIRPGVRCAPCAVNAPKCICEEDTPINAVCTKFDPKSGIAVMRSLDTKAGKGRVLMRGRYHNGAPIGTHKAFHENGQQASQFTYSDGRIEGEWREWYDNGKLSGRGAFKAGQQVGKVEFFYRNGKRMSVQKRDGTVVYYLDDGREFSRTLSGSEKPITFIRCKPGTERRDDSLSVTCVDPNGTPVGRYARYNAIGGIKQPLEVGVYVNGKKTRVRKFGGGTFRYPYSAQARPSFQ